LLLLQSIFCLKGADNRSRFLALSAISYIIFSIFSAILTNHFVIALILLVLCSAVLTFTTIRRVKDANLNKQWQFIYSALFLLTGIIVLFVGSSSYLLLILPILSSGFLLTYTSKPTADKSGYIYGYCGPVDLSEYIQKTSSNNRRIEPTLASQGVTNQEFDARVTESLSPYSNCNEPNDSEPNDNNSDDSHPENNHPENSHSDNSNFNHQQKTSSAKIDIGEQIRITLLTNKKLQMGIAVLVAIIVISVVAISISSLYGDTTEQQLSESEQLAQEQKVNAEAKLIERTDLLAMPDNFTLYLSQHQGLIINWQADEVDNGELWSQQSTQGDKSCKTITFNKGDDVRTLQVAVEETTEYYAHFSPLDTKELIKALAFRGSFTLCGYKFSLKGSQAVLGRNDSYGQYIDY
jgi:hypothetical protein